MLTILALKRRVDKIFIKSFKDKAIEHYEKFLTLWKDADPGIPEDRTYF